MPRYYFHLFNDDTAFDREGIELSDAAEAMRCAAKDARIMAAESVRKGHLILDHRIEVTDENGAKVGTVRFRDVVEVLDSPQPD
jgi:hypothetical protein